MNGNGIGPKVLQVQPWPQPCDACGELSVMFQTVSHQNPLATGLSLPGKGNIPGQAQAQFQGEVAFALCLNCGYRFKCDVDRKTNTWRKVQPMALQSGYATDELRRAAEKDYHLDEEHIDNILSLGHGDS